MLILTLKVQREKHKPSFVEWEEKKKNTQKTTNPFLHLPSWTPQKPVYPAQRKVLQVLAVFYQSLSVTPSTWGWNSSFSSKCQEAEPQEWTAHLYRETYETEMQSWKKMQSRIGLSSNGLFWLHLEHRKLRIYEACFIFFPWLFANRTLTDYSQVLQQWLSKKQTVLSFLPCVQIKKWVTQLDYLASGVEQEQTKDKLYSNSVHIPNIFSHQQHF